MEKPTPDEDAGEEKFADAWQLLCQHYPEIGRAISGSIEGILSLSSLDEKTAQLVYIAAQTAMNYPLAVKYHVPLALKAGASADEIVGAAAIAAAVAGPKGFVSCFPAMLEELDKHAGGQNSTSAEFQAS